MTTETDVIDEVQRRLDTFHSPSFDRGIVEQLLALARRSAAAAEPAAADDTVFAWAWTLFGNGQIWQRRLTWTKDAGCGAERREDQPTVAPDVGWREAFDDMLAALTRCMIDRDEWLGEARAAVRKAQALSPSPTGGDKP